MSFLLPILSLDKQRRIEINLDLDEKKKKKQNAVMAEAGEGGPTGGATTRKFIDIPMTDPKIIGAETDLIKLIYEKPVDLSEIQKKFFAGLPKMDRIPASGDGYDWTTLRKLLSDFVQEVNAEDKTRMLPIFNDTLNKLDPEVKWDKWLGTPNKNPIQEFDK